MAFTELERKRIERTVGAFIERKRPPPHIRSELDLGFRVSGQGKSVEIFEIRPRWRERSEIMEHSVSKATYVKTQDCWKVFWLRADLKWHSYSPMAVVDSIEKFLALVEADNHACIFG